TARRLSSPRAAQTGLRPEFEREPLDAAGIGEIERPLPLIERIVHNDVVQRAAILLALVLCWELYARWLGNALLFPTFTETMGVFARDIATGVLPDRILTSLKSLAIGYAAGVALAALFTTVAVASEIGTRLLSTLTAMFNPLPPIHPAPRDRAPAARLDLVRARHSLARVRDRAFGVVGGGAQYAVRLPQRAGDAAHERAQSRAEGRALRRPDPDSGGVSLDPRRVED